jgi:hypothetical protein
VGSTQRPRDATRERRACDGSPSGDRERAASGPTFMYAGDCGREEGASSNHRRRSSERALGRDGSLRGDDAIRRPRAPSGVWTDAVDFPLGVDLLASHRTFGAQCGMRPRCFFRETHRSRTRRDSFLLRVGRAARHAPTFGSKATVAREPASFGTTASAIAGARQGRDSLPSSTVGSGTPKRVWNRKAKRPAPKRLGGAKCAAASRKRVDPKPMGASSGAEPKGYVAATDSSVEQGPEVGRARSATWQHASGCARNDERERQPVNAADSERGRRGDGMVEGCRGGESFEGSSPLGKTPSDREVRDLRVAGGRKADRGVGNVVNPTAGCRVQQTCGSSKGRVLGLALCGGNR